MSDRTTPKQQRGIDTRARLVEAANAVYEREGRDSLKTQDVQKESGLSIGTLYRYFSNRAEILEAVMAYRVSQGLEEAPEAAQASPVVDERAATAIDAVEAIKNWCLKVIDRGEGKHDLKTAGQFILKEIEQRGL